MLQQDLDPALADDEYATALSQQPQIEAEEFSAIFAEINRLEEAIFKSHRLPLTGKTMVNEDELLAHIDLIRSSIPQAIKTAQEILEYKNQIIKEAQAQAQQVIAEANRHAYQVTNQLGIIDRAEAEAEQIRQMTISECEQIRQQTTIEVDRIRDRHIQEIEQMRETVMWECQQMQDGADEYAKRVLSGMEFQLNDVLQAIQRGKQQLSLESQALRTSQPSERELTNLDDRA